MANSRLLNVDHTITDKTITRDVWNYVLYLEKIGVSKDDRVMISGENSYEFILALFSLIQLDCSIVLVDSSLDDKELLRIARHSNSSFFITDRVICQSNDSIDSIKMLLLPFGFPTDTALEGNIDMTVWEQRKDALILYTSGSTGEPKGIIKSGESFLLNIRATIKRMDYYHNDVLLPLIPFTHFYGLSIIFIWWMTRCDLVLCNYRSMRSIVKAIIDKNVTVVDAIPSSYYVLNRLFTKRTEVLNNIKNSNVRMWCVGGAPLFQKLSKEFITHMGMPLLDGYGLSEAGNVALNTNGPEFGCGKPLDDVTIKIVSSDGEELSVGQLGEIMLKTPGLMERYYQSEEATNAALQNGWLKTNDLGYLDQWGNLFVIGRVGDEILRKGYIIYPASIEKTLEDKLGIKSKIVSYKDEKKGSLMILMIEADEENTEILRHKIYATLNTISRPDRIYIIKRFPYLNNGKIDYKTIKKLAIQLDKKVTEGEICQLELL